MLLCTISPCTRSDMHPIIVIDKDAVVSIEAKRSSTVLRGRYLGWVCVCVCTSHINVWQIKIKWTFHSLINASLMWALKQISALITIKSCPKL